MDSGDAQGVLRPLRSNPIQKDPTRRETANLLWAHEPFGTCAEADPRHPLSTRRLSSRAGLISPENPSVSRVTGIGEKEVRLERMTWPEIGEAIERGMRTVIVPSGAVEQHGPHLPLLTDSASASAVALNLAHRLGDALVAPTLWLGCSDHHMGFPGTISVRPETLEALYRDSCASLAWHGFETIVCFSWHSGNYAALRDMETRLNDAVEGRGRVIVWADMDSFFNTVRGVIEEELGLGERVGGHADIFEASTMSHLHPELVREDRAEPGYLGPIDEAFLTRVFSEGVRVFSANGVLGDPRGMDAEAGRICVERVSELIHDALRPDAQSAADRDRDEAVR